MSDVSSTRSKFRQTEDFRDAIDSALENSGEVFFAIGLSAVTTAWVVTRTQHMKSGMEPGGGTFALRMDSASHDFAGALIRYIDYRSCGV